MNRLLLTVFLVLVGLGCGGLMGSAHFQHVQDDEPSATVKSDARKAFMRGKLASNQLVVEGLSMKDFKLIRKGAEEVTSLVKGQHWFVLDTQEYKNFSKEMEGAATRLLDAANQENIEAATLRYFDLTLKCIDCHRYLETLGH